MHREKKTSEDTRVSAVWPAQGRRSALSASKYLGVEYFRHCNSIEVLVGGFGGVALTPVQGKVRARVPTK